MAHSLREKALSALNKFHDELPDVIDLNTIFDHLRNDPNDRSVVLLGASLLNDCLKAAIKTDLRKLNSDEAARLFAPDQPLSSFSAKIRLAYAMSIIDRRMQRDLDAIRTIRNAFAHVLIPLSFREAVVSDVCDHFYAASHLPKGPHNARNRFVWLVADCAEKITEYALPKLYPEGVPPPGSEPPWRRKRQRQLPPTHRE